MQQRRLGRTNLAVSAVGFGTCQLRLVTETQAIDTLLQANPNATQDQVSEIYAEFTPKLEALEQQYPSAEFRPGSFYGMNPGERGQEELERLLSYDTENKPEYPPEGSSPAVIGL